MPLAESPLLHLTKVEGLTRQFMPDLMLCLQQSHAQNCQQCCQQLCANGGKCPQEAMEEISGLEVGCLSSAVVMTVREGGSAHIFKLLLQKDKDRKAKWK